MGLGYSADSRATVHTPKRVFVRFHFTPNYLVHTRRKWERSAGEQEGTREQGNECKSEKENVCESLKEQERQSWREEREREGRRDIVATV